LLCSRSWILRLPFVIYSCFMDEGISLMLFAVGFVIGHRGRSDGHWTRRARGSFASDVLCTNEASSCSPVGWMIKKECSGRVVREGIVRESWRDFVKFPGDSEISPGNSGIPGVKSRVHPHTAITLRFHLLLLGKNRPCPEDVGSQDV